MALKEISLHNVERIVLRTREINAMGYTCDDSHPCFDEVMAIYESDAETYEEFKQKQKEVA